MITKETATNIALAYREVEAAEELLSKIADAIDRRRQPDLRDAFGRLQGLQLGVPSSDTSKTLFNVPWSMARPIIETHIATQKALIKALTEQALVEATTPSAE